MLDPETLLLEHLPQIEQMAISLGRRRGLDPGAIEEFVAEVKLHLVADDYAAIRGFQGRSAFLTYISAVISRLFVDLLRRDIGKWHASAVAERLGPVAVELEQLRYRDGRTLEEASSELSRKYPELSRTEIEALDAQLPPRTRRRTVGLDAVADAIVGDTDSVARAQMAGKISNALCAHIPRLSHEDQLLFRLRFGAEMSVPRMARSLHMDQQVLYRRLHKILGSLKDELERAGIRADDAEELIGDDSVVLDFQLNKVSDP